MARLALWLRQQRLLGEQERARRGGRKPRFLTRVTHRCALCWRRRGYMRFFGVCRICFREKAANGEIPGVTKSSW